MRSVSATLLLALAAVISVGLAGLRLFEGNLSRVFGAPPAELGAPLYRFDPNEAVEMRLSGNGIGAHCVKTDTGWRVVEPWEDRMDPRVAQALFNFTLGTRVEGAIPEEKVESVNLGFSDGQIGVRIADANEDPLAKFMIGHRTAWMGTDAETGDPIPTVYVQPRDRSRKDYLYACTDPSDIHAVLGEGFKHLRDHHPFLFHPSIVRSMRIKNRSGEMLLSRDASNELWDIVKPLGLKSNREAVVRLLQGLYDLEALSVVDRASVTLPTTDPETLDQIGLTFFGSEREFVLEIYPPEEPDDTTVLAKISDRPSAIFELPLTPAAGPAEAPPVALSELPLSVNELRDPTLASINPRNLSSILVSPAAGEDILIRRDSPAERYKVMLDGRLRDPSETALFALLQAVNEGRVSEFVSDSATDLAPYGLDTPFLVLRFLSFDGSRLELDFGQDTEGRVHAMREGTTTVVRVDPAVMSLIPTRPWDWLDPAVWRVDAVNLSSIVRTRDDQQLTLTQVNPVTETWRAELDGENVTDRLSKERTEILMRNLLELEAVAWLPPGEETATEALAKPDLVFTLLARDYDNQGELAGIIRPELRIARIKQGDAAPYYGSVSTEPSPFLLKAEDVELLSVDLIDVE